VREPGPPPRTPPTNAVEVVRRTNPPVQPVVATPPATQAPPVTVVRVTPPPRTSPPPAHVSAPAQPVAQSVPPPAAAASNLPVTVVRLNEEPPPQPARDEEPAAPTREIPATNPVVTAPRSATTPGDSEVATAPKPARKSLLQKINPFKRRTKSEPEPSEPPRRAETTVAAVPRSEPTNAPAPIATNPPPVAVGRPAPPPPPRVEPPRYHYLDLKKPAPGNRAAADPLVAAGYEAQKARRLDEAARQYAAALKHDPSYFEASYNLTLVALDVGDLPAALHAGELSLAIKPDSHEARVNFAMALDRAGYWADAALELEKALQTAPGDAKAHLLLANLFAQKLGLPGKARPHYQRVLEIDPRHPRASEIRYWLAANP